jgi:calcineurin-like phosphoesterase family protein
MPSVFLVSDTHFGHTGVCRFTRNDGVTKLRPWDSADEWTKLWLRLGTKGSSPLTRSTI